MAKKHSSFLVAFPVSSVYFGALVGPSMVSGVFAAVYLSLIHISEPTRL